MNQTNLTPPWNEKSEKKNFHYKINQISLQILIQIQTEKCNPHKIKGYTHTHLRKEYYIINIQIAGNSYQCIYDPFQN